MTTSFTPVKRPTRTGSRATETPLVWRGPLNSRCARMVILRLNEDLLSAAQLAADPARLVCEPSYYHAAGAFGVWSLPDRSSPAKARLETKLDQAFSFYQGQVEQRGWYGFWDYGDVMHSYDPNRHIWRYDLGALAWQQTEQMPDMWLWYAFLRTGRADVFRMAEAMTRNTQEVDVYHLGRFQDSAHATTCCTGETARRRCGSRRPH